MREGSLDAPTRHPVPWRDEEFYDEAKLDAELRRVFDICHGCRRCFNLCDSFPRLFDLIDESPTFELDSVESKDFKPVVDACTLCDMCFLTKCPYVPPHEFNIDFPHLMLRYRAVEARKGQVSAKEDAVTRTDRNGALGSAVSPLANWVAKEANAVTRPLMEKIAHVHRDARLPRYAGKTFTVRSAQEPPDVDVEAPAFGRRAVLYATCFVNYNNPDAGTAARAILARNGVETAVVYPRCCGMPQLEHGDIAKVAESATRVAAELRAYVDDGWDIVSLVPSCSLMLKFEWPLLVPENEDVKALSAATFDLPEYVVDIAKKEGLVDGLTALDGDVTVHVACHARAQNMGQKVVEMLRLIPDTPIKVIERCSGHGGSWGVMKDNFDVALKVGKPVAREARKFASRHLTSECPLAAEHIVQGMERLDANAPVPRPLSPIELLARAYGLDT